MSQELMQKISEKLGVGIDLITFENAKEIADKICNYILYRRITYSLIAIVVLVMAMKFYAWYDAKEKAEEFRLYSEEKQFILCCIVTTVIICIILLCRVFEVIFCPEISVMNFILKLK